MASTRDRILHYLPRQVKFYSLSFHVIDIKRLFRRNKLLLLSWKVSFYRIRGLVNNINISNMVAVSLLQLNNDAGASCPKLHRTSCQLQNIANFQVKNVSNFMECSIDKMTLKHKKTCRNKLTLSSGTLMFRLKDKFSVFPNFFDEWNFFIEDCTFLH